MGELTFSKKMEILTAPIENPKWRIQSKGPKTGKKTFCIVVPYVDARMVQERFDKAFGAASMLRSNDERLALIFERNNELANTRKGA